MAVVTNEGATLGLRAQVVDVSDTLQAARQLTRNGHAVVFGDGENGDQHYVVNRVTGEVNTIRDDCVNYSVGLHATPSGDAGFERPVKP